MFGECLSQRVLRRGHRGLSGGELRDGLRHRRRRMRDMPGDDAHLQWRTLRLQRDDAQLRHRLLQWDDLPAWDHQRGLWRKWRGVRGLRRWNTHL